MDRIFQGLSAVLVGVAIFFWYKENSDWTFAAVVCAIASFFIGMRFQMKERIRQADEEEAAANQIIEDEEGPEEDK